MSMWTTKATSTDENGDPVVVDIDVDLAVTRVGDVVSIGGVEIEGFTAVNVDEVIRLRDDLNDTLAAIAMEKREIGAGQ